MDGCICAGVAIKAVHLQELRTNVDQALSTLGFATQPYTDPNLIGIGVKKTHRGITPARQVRANLTKRIPYW
jgi:hypothetical protein